MRQEQSSPQRKMCYTNHMQMKSLDFVSGNLRNFNNDQNSEFLHMPSLMALYLYYHRLSNINLYSSIRD